MHGQNEAGRKSPLPAVVKLPRQAAKERRHPQDQREMKERNAECQTKPLFWGERRPVVPPSAIFAQGAEIERASHKTQNQQEHRNKPKEHNGMATPPGPPAPREYQL